MNSFDDVARNTLDEWIYFLKNSEIKNEFKARGLQEAKEKMRTDNLEGDERMDYEAYIKEQRILMVEFDTAVFDATVAVEERLMPIIKQQNKELKVKDEKLKEKDTEFIFMIKNLRAKGLSNMDIAQIRGRTIGEIESI